ncbi:MAG: zinc ribbon domain-containing protein [Oligoflexia bacterium]|nr:zinc ribbon domain-containing protein [Oligoflexia bacterium]
MPVYEYQCSDCRKVHEVRQKFSDPLLTECPECQGSLTKLLSLTSFALKGSGWYTSDYKRSGAAKSETKPEAKAESPCASGACGTSSCPAAASS